MNECNLKKYLSFEWKFFLIKYLFFKNLSSRSTNCKGRLHKPVGVDDAYHFKLRGNHLHEPDARKIAKKSVMTKLKTLSKTKATTRQVMSESMQNVKDASKAIIPGPRDLIRAINRYRQDSDAPKNPKNLSELYFPEKYCKTESGKNFILHDTGPTDESYDMRIVMFGTEDNLKFLATCTEIYMDGTFKVVPPLFSQLYTIHGKSNRFLKSSGIIIRESCKHFFFIRLIIFVLVQLQKYRIQFKINKLF